MGSKNCRNDSTNVGYFEESHTVAHVALGIMPLPLPCIMQIQFQRGKTAC